MNEHFISSFRLVLLVIAAAAGVGVDVFVVVVAEVDFLERLVEIDLDRALLEVGLGLVGVLGPELEVTLGTLLELALVGLDGYARRMLVGKAAAEVQVDDLVLVVEERQQLLLLLELLELLEHLALLQLDREVAHLGAQLLRLLRLPLGEQRTLRLGVLRQLSRVYRVHNADEVVDHFG